MCAQGNAEAFAESVMRRLDRETFLSLSPRQRASIRSALRAEFTSSEHTVDARWVVPLLFGRVCIGLLAGRDRRTRASAVQAERRRMTSVLMGLLIALVALLPLLLVGLGCLYALKSAVGINLFTDVHLKDMLGF